VLVHSLTPHALIDEYRLFSTRLWSGMGNGSFPMALIKSSSWPKQKRSAQAW